MKSRFMQRRYSSDCVEKAFTLAPSKSHSDLLKKSNRKERKFSVTCLCMYIRSVITCTTTHVIYLICCPCGLAYVGKTVGQLKQRISEHKSLIWRNERNYPVAVHFNEFNHDISTLRFTGIEKVCLPKRGGNHDLLLKKHEAYWIHTLKTLTPLGMNDELLLNVML